MTPRNQPQLNMTMYAIVFGMILGALGTLAAIVTSRPDTAEVLDTLTGAR